MLLRVLYNTYFPLDNPQINADTASAMRCCFIIKKMLIILCLEIEISKTEHIKSYIYISEWLDTIEIK